MSFLKIGDRAAGAIKSGGTTRRAAKMVIVDADHPDIEDFINWKVIEEQKVAAMVAGSKLAEKHLNAIIKACVNCEGSGDDCFDPSLNPALKREIRAARKAYIPDNYIDRVAIQCVNTLTPKWSSRLAAYDVFIWDQCYAMEQSLRID